MTVKHITAATLALALASCTVTTFAQRYYGQGYPPPPPGYASGGWDRPPQEFQEIQRQGFHDGIEGARHDFDNHRFPNVNNRDEYRHPHVPRSARADYRAGFQHGYDVAMNHLLHEGAGPR